MGEAYKVTATPSHSLRMTLTSLKLQQRVVLFPGAEVLPANMVPMAAKYQGIQSQCAMHAVACCPALNNIHSMLLQLSLRDSLERDVQLCCCC